MNNQKIVKKVKKLSQDFFKKMGFKVKCEIEVASELIFLNLKTEDSALLIGYRGGSLAAIQHILRKILNRDLEQPLNLIVDVEGYKNKKKEYLNNLVKRLAEKVLRTDRLELLRPMAAHERKIVHLALAGVEGVTTESVGEEPNRRVMIKKVKS